MWWETCLTEELWRPGDWPWGRPRLPWGELREEREPLEELRGERARFPFGRSCNGASSPLA